MVSKFSHPAKTPEPKFFRFFENVIFFRDVLLLNTALPIFVKESGNVTLAK